MQVGINVTCMHTSFGGRGLSGFGDMATFQKRPNFPFGHVKCMHTSFGGRGLSGFEDKISLWSIKVKKFNRSESAQKIHASRLQCHVMVMEKFNRSKSAQKIYASRD